MNKRALVDEPVDYILTVHIQNLMATYGEEHVKKFINDVFVKGKKNATRTKSIKKVV